MNNNSITLNNARNRWMKTDNFKSLTDGDEFCSIMRVYFTLREQKELPLYELDARFEEFISNIAPYPEFVLALDSFLDFVDYWQKNHGKEPILRITHKGIHQFMKHYNLKKGEDY